MTYDDVRLIKKGDPQPVEPQVAYFMHQLGVEARRAVACYQAQKRFFEALNQIGWQPVYHLAADTRYRIQGTMS